MSQWQMPEHDDDLTQWVLIGAAPDDGDDESNDEDDDEQAEPADDADDEDESKDGDEDDDDEDVDWQQRATTAEERLAEAEARADKFERRLKSADQRANGYFKQLQDGKAKAKPGAKEKDGDEPTDASAQRIAELENRLAEQSLQSTFAGLTKYQWQDSNAAFRLLDVSDVKRPDGTFDLDAVEDAAAKLAKASPWLIKRPETAKPKQERPTGSQPKQDRNRSKTDRSELGKRFPALNGRI